MDLSVVSGTFNRLSYLQKMVASARASVGNYYGLAWEFCLVDGGSTDGTQDWCRSQPDIKLLEHKKLLGAVKAFNDGCAMAQGDYVVLANDDVEFRGDTLLLGWLWMQTHPDCGVGCFYQDRNGHAWHVENMPVVVAGVQSSAPYGQVCIVPRWLGNRCGWWGNYLHTYGGDNELSANVYEAGYRVQPVPGTQVHDDSPMDDLRKINNMTGASDPRAVRGHHPDSWAWGRKWRRGALAGPEVRDVPAWPNPLPPRERTVYLPIFEQGWAVQKEQKRGLREALARVGLVAEVDYMGEAQAVGKSSLMSNLLNLCQKFNPTILLTQLHDVGIIGPEELGLLRRAAPHAVFVNWNGDFWPENLIGEKGIQLARAVDLQLTVNRDVLEKYQAMGVKAGYWQIGWEPDGVGQEPGPGREVVFLANNYSKARMDLVKQIRAMGFDFGLWGQGWPEGWSSGQTLYDFKRGCSVLRGARIALGDSQWPESGFVSNRVMQTLAAGGCALAHQWFRGMEELGLEDGKTCVIWRDVRELGGKLRYYLDHEQERAAVAAAGERLALERHSFDARVKELLGWLRREPARETEEEWR